MEICTTCGHEGDDVNITTLAMFDLWFCSGSCLQQFAHDHFGGPTWSTYEYLVEQQKEVMRLFDSTVEKTSG